ncbi:MAG: hypothetical protein ACR2RV_02015, partial [Verrucomicrobiales bacterium]
QLRADRVLSADVEIDDSEAAVGELVVRNELVLKVEPTSPVALAGAGDLFVGARLPQLDQAYHVQIPGSAFIPDQNPYSFTVDGKVLGDGDQRFLRLALWEAP